MKFSMPLKVSITEKEPGVFIVAPVGSIDTDTYEYLEEKIQPVLDNEPKAIMLDMAGVSYISSAGVGVIIKAERAVKQHGGVLVMSNMQPPVKKVFDVLKVIPRQQMFTSIAELDSYLDAIQRKERKANP